VSAKRGESADYNMRSYRMKNMFGVAAVMLSLSALAFADESGLVDKNAGIVTKPSKYSVAETIDRVETAAKGVGANIFNRIDYSVARVTIAKALDPLGSLQTAPKRLVLSEA
jgi:hypothetical protein